MIRKRQKWDYSLLRGRIVSKCGTMKEFATSLGISYATLSRKMNSLIDFSQEEIIVACFVLDITGDEIKDYFFTKVVQ